MMWIHPAIGAVAVLSMLWLGTQGMRSRHRKAYAPESRKRHRRWSRGVAVLIVTAALLGTASVAWIRSDLKLAGSVHFWMGWATAGLALALAGTGPRIHEDPDSKRIHPPTGITALVFAVLTMALGMGLLP